MKQRSPHAPLWGLVPFVILICAAFGLILFALLAPQGCDRACMLTTTALGAVLGASLGSVICVVPLFIYLYGVSRSIRQREEILENERKRRKMEEIQRFWQNE